MIRVQVQLAETIKAESKRKGKGEERQQAKKRIERMEKEIERKKGLKAQCYSEYKHGGTYEGGVSAEKGKYTGRNSGMPAGDPDNPGIYGGAGG